MMPGLALAWLMAAVGCAHVGAVEVGGAGVAEVAGPPRTYFDGPWPREALTAEWLDKLLAPIALYPDPLLAQMLPASTYPVEVVRAKRLLDKGVGLEEIDGTDLDVSVKGLARYPGVIALMDEQIEWTERLGQAFLDQQEEVMSAVQRLRVRAVGFGNLYTTAQQEVYYETEHVRIVPVTEYVYVPVYDAPVVYTRACPPYARSPYVSFGDGCAVGPWLNYDCDWRGRRVCRPENWSWQDYCRRDRRGRDDHHGHGHGHGRAAFAAEPRAAEHNGTREQRLVRPEPGPLTPDRPVVHNERKPGAPGGRPTERVRGVEPTGRAGMETPRPPRTPAPAAPPPPTAAPPAAQRAAPPSAEPPVKTPRPRARGAELPERVGEEPKRRERAEAWVAKPRVGPGPVALPEPVAPPSARTAERPKGELAGRARESKRERTAAVAAPPAVRAAAAAPSESAAPRVEAVRPARGVARVETPSPRPAPEVSKVRGESSPPAHGAVSGTPSAEKKVKVEDREKRAGKK